MTSTTERYRAAASQSASTVERIADFWTKGSQRLSDHMLPGLPQVDLVPVVERYFEFVQRTVDISRNLTLSWAEAAGTLSGAVREQAESMGGLVREQAGSARDFVHEQAGKAEQADHQDEQSDQHLEHGEATLHGSRRAHQEHIAVRVHMQVVSSTLVVFGKPV